MIKLTSCQNIKKQNFVLFFERCYIVLFAEGLHLTGGENTSDTETDEDAFEIPTLFELVSGIQSLIKLANNNTSDV